MVIFCLTNLSLHSTNQSRSPVGSSDSAETPDFIKRSGSVWTLEANVPTKRKYNDNVCVFRAIAASQLGKIKGLQAKTMELFNLYMHGVPKIAVFTGIELTDLPNVETQPG